jgi:hypothetical protein
MGPTLLPAGGDILMTINNAISELMPYSSRVPTNALDTIRSNWSEAEPILLAELDHRLADPLEEERSALFLYALYLCAEMRCEAAFDRYLTIARLPNTVLDFVLGDILTEAFPKMLGRTCAGRVDALKELIEDRTVNGYSRGGAAGVLCDLVAAGELDRPGVEAYCLELLSDRLERTQGYIWDEIITMAERLHLQEALPLIEAAYENGWADPYMQTLEEVKKGMASGEDPDPYRRPPFSNAEKEMHFFVSQWAVHPDEEEPDTAELLAEPAAARKAAARRPQGKEPGRNEPCPCGSGKKYKKCCIHTGGVADAAAEDPFAPLNKTDEWMAAGYYYHEKRYAYLAQQCWWNAWQSMADLLPSTILDPDNDECDLPFNCCDFFSDWLQDYMMLLDNERTKNAAALRNGLIFCREALERFPAMDKEFVASFKVTQAHLLVAAGDADAGIAIFETMISEHPEEARGYVMLSDLFGFFSGNSGLPSDYERAEQLLTRALISAKDCDGWDVEARLADLRELMQRPGSRK